MGVMCDLCDGTGVQRLRGGDRECFRCDGTGERAAYDDLYVYVCPYCRRQYADPHGHHVVGDDCASSCFHRRPGERGVTQPKLVRIKVEPVEPFAPREIPADQPPIAERMEAE